MKKIVYTNSQGGVSVVTPAEGARLALQVQMPDSSVIIFDGAKFMRLPSDAAAAMTKQRQPVTVDSFLRRWPVDGVTAEWAESEAVWLARIQAKDVPADASDVAIVDEVHIPADRTFRNAWRACPTNGCRVDMPAAVEIHKDTLRALRAPKLAALDVEFIRAVESGDSTRQAEIAAEKATLRDVTKHPDIAAAATPDDLKAVIPDVLR